MDPQTICTIQRTCCTTRRWNYDTLQEWKLDWMYKNVEEVLGARRTNQLRDGSLTSVIYVILSLVLKGERQSERH